MLFISNFKEKTIFLPLSQGRMQKSLLLLNIRLQSPVLKSNALTLRPRQICFTFNFKTFKGLQA